MVHCRRWTRALADRGHQISLLTPESRKIKNVQEIPAPLYPHGKTGFSRLKQGINNVYYCRQKIRDLQPDLIHLMGLFRVLSPDLMWTLQSLSPLIISPWGTDITGHAHQSQDTWKSWGMKRFILSCGTIITATSQYLARETQKYLSATTSVHVVPYGVDINRFSPQKPSDTNKNESVSRGIRILFPKKLEPVYGADLLIRAFARARTKDPRLQLQLLGEGSQKSTLKKLVQEQDVAKEVTFRGFVPYDQMPEIFRQSDLVVLPSRQESFGVAALEAQAAGLPVIGCNVGGMSEVIKHQKTGYLIQPEDEEALARSILELARDPETRRKLGNRGRTFVENHFNWPSCVDRMEQIYQLALD